MTYRVTWVFPLFPEQVNIVSEHKTEKEANKKMKKCMDWDGRLTVEYRVIPYKSPEEIEAEKELNEYLANN